MALTNPLIEGWGRLFCSGPEWELTIHVLDAGIRAFLQQESDDLHLTKLAGDGEHRVAQRGPFKRALIALWNSKWSELTGHPVAGGSS